jgi:hypothetical protein
MAAAVAAAGIGGAALSSRPTVTYTAANPTTAAIAAVAREATAVLNALCPGVRLSIRSTQAARNIR